ncbi:MAG: hypothetical protein VX899_20030 [Myxococcota bacterium]|nr:hypothetical protein [Myxococcota bacterium]
MSLVLALACAVSEPAPELQDTGTAESQEPTPYVVVTDEEAEPPLSAEALAQGVNTAIDALLRVDPLVFHGAYEGLREAGSDGDCPYYYDSYLESYGQYYWIDDCESDGGSAFSGNGRSYLTHGNSAGSYDYDYQGYFYGSGSITGAAGERIAAAGYSNSYEAFHTGNSYDYFYHDMWGEFSSSNAGLDDTWLGETWRLDHTLSANRSPTGGLYISLNSAISGLSGPVNAAVLEGVVIYDEARGSPCPSEPSGVISLRDAQGRWVELRFDGVPSGGTTMYPPDCDGCGRAWLDGNDIGEVCPDFSALLDWEERPWR